MQTEAFSLVVALVQPIRAAVRAIVARLEQTTAIVQTLIVARSTTAITANHHAVAAIVALAEEASVAAMVAEVSVVVALAEDAVLADDVRGI